MGFPTFKVVMMGLWSVYLLWISSQLMNDVVDYHTTRALFQKQDKKVNQDQATRYDFVPLVYAAFCRTLPLFFALLMVLVAPVLLWSILRAIMEKWHLFNKGGSVLKWLPSPKVVTIPVPPTEWQFFDVLLLLGYAVVVIAYISVEEFPRQVGQPVLTSCAFIVIPVLRNSIVAKITSVPFERGVKYHRWLGRAILLLLSIHMFGYWYQWDQEGIFPSENAKIKNVYGTTSWAACMVLFFLSINYIRRHWFEVFYYSHVVAFLLFLIFGILHYRPMLLFMMPTIVLYALDLLIRCGKSYRKVQDVQLIVQDGVARLTGRQEGLSFEGGSYAFLCFPSISKLQWHPISFASSPLENGAFVFLIKQLGGWSKKLEELPPHPRVWIDGPYGSPSVSLHHYPLVIFIGGGIGITPMISMLGETIMEQRKVTLERAMLVWTMREVSLYSLLEKEIEILNRNPRVDVHAHWTRGKHPTLLSGRPDLDVLLTSVREKFGDRFCRCAVMVCGPKTLVSRAHVLCTDKTDRRFRFDFHSETFEF